MVHCAAVPDKPVRGASDGGERLVGLVLSYSRKDSQFADLLQSILLSRGYDVWIDRRNIEVGTRWDDSIQTAIDVRSHLAVILSPTSVASQNVADEWSYAIEQGKTVVPIYYQECTVPMRLRRLQRVDFYQQDFTEKLGELQAALGTPDRRPNDRVELARRDGLISIRVPSADIRIAVFYSDYPQVDSFIRTVWCCLLWSIIPRGTTQDHFYEYGTQWVFKNTLTGEVYKIPEKGREALIHDMGIEPDSELEIILQ
jgi:hypothetical protein